GRSGEASRGSPHPGGWSRPGSWPFRPRGPPAAVRGGRAVEPAGGKGAEHRSLALAHHLVAAAEAVALAGVDEEAPCRDLRARPGAPREKQAGFVGVDAERGPDAGVRPDRVQDVLDLGEWRRLRQVAVRGAPGEILLE